MRCGQSCKGGKCRSGKTGDSRGGKCLSKSYGTPTRDYIEKALSYFVRLVLILLTEKNVLGITLKIVAAFACCILVDC